EPGRRPREDGRAVHQVGVRDPQRRRGGQRAGARGHDRAHASDRPVFLSLPMDLMTDETDAPAPRTQGPSAQRPGIPGMADVTRACGLLAGARAPLIIAGDGVGRAPDGVAALTRLAQAPGARVYGEPIYRRTNFPGDHSLWRGGLYPSVPVVRKTLDDADVILIVGADVFTWFLHGPGAPFRPGVPVIQLADDSRQIGRSYP